MFKKLYLGSVALFLTLTASVVVADAACTVPVTLTNGTTADATQVMSNFTSIAGCAAPLGSPSFTGTLTAPDGSTWTSTNGIIVGASSGFTVDNTLSYRTAAHQVNLNGNSAGNLTLQGDGAGANSIVIQNGSASYAMSFWGGTQRMTILNNGNVGIGTASPTSALLAVNGITVINGTNGAAGASANAKLVIGGTPATVSFAGSNADAKIDTPNGSSGTLTYDSGTHIFDINASEKMRIASSGNVGIATSSPSYTLHVNGSVAGTSAYNNLSDARLKKNVVPLVGGLALISQLQPVRYDWRSNSERQVGKELNLPAGKQIGFIAQDVAKILPEATSTAKGRDAIMSVAESKIVPVLVMAVKELKAANDNQAAEIAQLEGRVAALQRKLVTQTAQK